MQINEIIKELRLSNNLTQKQLGQALGYGHAIVGFWESGQRLPAFEALKRLAKYFEVSTDYLLGLEDENGNKI